MYYLHIILVDITLLTEVLKHLVLCFISSDLIQEELLPDVLFICSPIICMRFQIYEITGQVKGHSWEVKWEAKICKTKEMTGQCQMKGQKSSDRLSVDESEWSVCWTSGHSEVSQYSCRQSQSFLALEITIITCYLLLYKDMLLIYREKHH